MTEQEFISLEPGDEVCMNDYEESWTVEDQHIIHGISHILNIRKSTNMLGVIHNNSRILYKIRSRVWMKSRLQLIEEDL